MQAKEKIPVPSQIVGGMYETKDTNEAATLRALKVEPLSCRIDHNAQNPYESGRGDTVFSLAPTSSEWESTDEAGNTRPVTSRQLRAAYYSDGTPAAELDDLIEQIPDPVLRARIKSSLPLAIACFGRAIAEQRQQCFALIRTSPHRANGRARDGRKFHIDVHNHKFARKHGL